MDTSSNSRTGRWTSGGATTTRHPTTATSSSSVAPHVAAANSLQLLLAEDPSLLALAASTGAAFGPGDDASAPSPGEGGDDRAAFAYAARLLAPPPDGGGAASSFSSASASSSSATSKDRAELALHDVERKLALVESLAVKLSRTRPEEVAGQFLRLHGYGNFVVPERDEEGGGEAARADDSSRGEGAVSGSSTGTGGPHRHEQEQHQHQLTLAQIRDRADRLERQAGVLDGVASRVETSLARGYGRLESTCTRLERVLEASGTLKSLLRLTFESTKLLGYDVDDVRDLARAATSTAIVEELLLELPAGISLVEELRPKLLQKGRQVRQAASELLQQYHSGEGRGEGASAGAPGTSQPSVTLSQLGAILQVYYSLGELPGAVYRSVEQAHNRAEQATRMLLQHAGKMSGDGKKRRQARIEASGAWASSLTSVCLAVWNLQRVLQSKSDPNTREWFAAVVQAAPIPPSYLPFVQKKSSNSIWTLFWCRYCSSLSSLLNATIQAMEGGGSTGSGIVGGGGGSSAALEEVAALYPHVRGAAMELIGRLQDTPAWEDLLSTGGAAGSAGALPGSLGGGNLDDPFLQRSTGAPSSSHAFDNPQAAASARHSATSASSPAADVWTRPSGGHANQRNSWLGPVSTSMAFSTSAVMSSPEWKSLQAVGLYPLQQAFLNSCQKRLYDPLQYMFPVEPTVTIEDGGAAAAATAGMVMLPSKYDIQRFDENVRQELSLADPRKEGGGDLSLVGMIAECVCDMITVFCERAMTAVMGGDEASLLREDWNMSDAVQHDRKVAAILHATAKYLKAAGEKTFVAPYRPAVSPQHEEAARMCQAGLEPASAEIEKMVKNMILYPICRAVNRRILDVLAKMHHGVYVDSDDSSPSFVQKDLSAALERVGQLVLARFPPEYASVVAERIASFTILAFCSNAALIRPLGENARLHLTQDLADLELALEQLVLKNGAAKSLAQTVGKPYAELRAVRQMLFWTGLESSSSSAQDLAKALLRENWIQDVRPSTALHYLFSFAPNLLTSPHHSKRMPAKDYVASIVTFLGFVSEGEDAAWMTTMACCDSYQQRASSVDVGDGDTRVPQIILLLGQELVRRR